MNYGFFDYKGDIEGYNGQDMFGPAHICGMVAAFALLIALCILCRRISVRRVDVILKVLSIVVVVTEIAKISWETYHDIKAGGSFNFAGLLPVYVCSLFIYAMLMAAWTRGRVREAALSFLTTLGIFAGLTNFIYLNMLRLYPFFTYATFNSFIYHFLMVFVGIFLVSTGYYRPSLRSVGYSMAYFAVAAVVISAVNYGGNAYFEVDWFDYGFLWSGRSFPIPWLSSLCEALGPKLRPLYTVIATALYVLPTAAVWGIIALCLKINGRKKAAALDK